MEATADRGRLHCARYLVAASAQFTGHSFTWPVHAFAARELLAAAAQVFKLPTVKLSMDRIVLDDLRLGVVGGLGDRLQTMPLSCFQRISQRSF
jgi:hypothetical protein